MENISKQQPVSDQNKEYRAFGVLFGVILATLFGFIAPTLFDHKFPIWPWPIATAFVALALLYPKALKAPYKGWMAFGTVAGWLNTRIILAVLFFLVFTPIGLVVRLLGYDLLNTKLDKTAQSYRSEKPSQNCDHVENPY